MRIYSIVLSDISNQISDISMMIFIEDWQLEYWRHTALNWFLVTPDELDIEKVINYVCGIYNDEDVVGVFEIDIKKFGGKSPKMISHEGEHDVFQFFRKLAQPEYIPRWEKKNMFSVSTFPMSGDSSNSDNLLK